MKKTFYIILLLILSGNLYSQFRSEVYLVDKNTKEVNNRFFDRKTSGYYNVMQVNMMIGNVRTFNRTVYYPDYYPSPSSSMIGPVYSYPYSENKLRAIPSVTVTNGYMFNQHWAAGIGVGFEMYDHNLFPLFGEIRYTIWDNKISPFITIKGGYSFGNFKEKHHDELYLDWSPYYVSDVDFRNYGGLMLHPEIGVKVPLSENSDLLFTAAYRHQKIRLKAKKTYENNQFDEWEHKENLNRLSFGIAIMFR